jgi:hypothetical protein
VQCWATHLADGGVDVVDLDRAQRGEELADLVDPI